MTKEPKPVNKPRKETRGRPAKPHARVSMRFSATLLRQVDKAATRAKLTRTEWLELAAEEKLGRT